MRDRPGSSSEKLEVTVKRPSATSGHGGYHNQSQERHQGSRDRVRRVRATYMLPAAMLVRPPQQDAPGGMSPRQPGGRHRPAV